MLQKKIRQLKAQVVYLQAERSKEQVTIHAVRRCKRGWSLVIDNLTGDVVINRS
jgi:hypothetical protein